MSIYFICTIYTMQIEGTNLVDQKQRQAIQPVLTQITIINRQPFTIYHAQKWALNFAKQLSYLSTEIASHVY